MPYQLLIVEDNPRIIEALTEEFQQAFGGEMAIDSCNFNEALVRVRTVRPDIVILDQHEGLADDAARPIWDFIWQQHFCPIIIYSAFDFADYGPIDHPFTHYEPKPAAGSIQRVIARAKGFLEEADGLRLLRNEIDDRIADSLKLVSPLVWRETATLEQRSDLLRRVTRRRLAASLDSPSCYTDNVIALEQFICPPLENSLLTGDVIQASNSENNEASSFRLVLTPSCDLEAGDDRYPVSEVLVAHCMPVNDPEILRVYTLQQTPIKKLPEVLGSRLKSDRVANMCVLPSLNDVWPAMVVNLKKLALIERTRIALSKPAMNEESSFYRIASLDSPFRENMSWRYAQTSGRPGLPNLDTDILTKDIVTAAKALLGVD